MELLKAYKILAYGCDKRFLWFYIDSKSYCVRIDDKTYQYLKLKGVPTSQSLRKRYLKPLSCLGLKVLEGHIPYNYL